MTAILTHTTNGNEDHLLPILKLNGNYSDRDVMFNLPVRISNDIQTLASRGQLDVSKYSHLYIHEFRRWDERVIEDDRHNDISITVFGSDKPLQVQNIYSPDEGYQFSTELNGGKDGMLWQVLQVNGTPSVSSASSSPVLMPHYLQPLIAALAPNLKPVNQLLG